MRSDDCGELNRTEQHVAVFLLLSLSSQMLCVRQLAPLRTLPEHTVEQSEQSEQFERFGMQTLYKFAGNCAAKPGSLLYGSSHYSKHYKQSNFGVRVFPCVRGSGRITTKTSSPAELELEAGGFGRIPLPNLASLLGRRELSLSLSGDLVRGSSLMF